MPIFKALFGGGKDKKKKYSLKVPKQTGLGKGVVLKLKKPLIVRRDMDMKGATLEWHGKDAGKCDQKEGRPSAIIVLDGATIKNFTFSGDWPSPDGLNIRHGAIKYAWIQRYCEDAVNKTYDKAKSRTGTGTLDHVVIGSNKYPDGKDKAIQVNSGKLNVRSCTIKGGSKGIRTNGGSPRGGEPRIYLDVSDTRFLGCRRGIMCDPEQHNGVKVKMRNLEFKDVEEHTHFNKNVDKD